MLHKKRFKKQLLMSCIVLSSLFQPSLLFADVYQSALDCAAAEDYVCAFDSMVTFVEEKPSERPLFSDNPLSFTGLGNKLTEYLVMAEPALTPDAILTKSTKAVELLSAETKDPRTQQFFVPYYILNAEACQVSDDKQCFQKNANRLCDAMVEYGFLWPRERAANKPIKGRDRANVIRSSCPYKYKDTPKAVALFSKIGEYIASIEYGGDIDNYRTLYVPPAVLERIDKRNRWPKMKANIEKRNPSLLNILNYIKSQQPMFEKHPSGYMATFDLRDYSDGSNGKTISFVMKDNVWYVR